MTMDLSTSIANSELHRYAEALLVHLTADGSASEPPPGTADVPGCWLAPAAQALALILSGEEALEPLSRAAQLNEERTALFLCLALAVSGHGDRIHASWLGTAFGELSADRPVTAGQRALWLAAARGAYGPAGKIFVLRKLDTVAIPAQDELWLKALVPGEPPVVVPPSLVDFPDLAVIPELAAPAQAAERLTRLRHRCLEITSPQPTFTPLPSTSPYPTEHPPPTPGTGPFTGPGTASSTRPGTTPAAGSVGGPDTRTGTGPSTTLGAGPGPAPGTRSGHGSASQQPRSRAWPEAEPLAVLRALIRQDEPSGPLSSLSGHLLEDVRPGADPHLAAIALHAAAPAVKAAAEHLAEETGAHPPESVAMPILGHQIQLRPDGPESTSMKAAEDQIVASVAPARPTPFAAYALLILGVLLLGTGVVLSPFVCLAGLAVVAWGGRQMLQERSRQRADLARVSSRVAELHELAGGAVWALHAYAREATHRSETAEAELAEIVRLLRRGPRAA
ncbi:hypothetical protein J5X84_23065 [Streptosporangiaceae bacterium NEAU-GS5]|nr:hypothetical protein [Streptosporangiaceae bacterium NEAU-GS5]